jgi:D-alanyl-D-alanine carboxypeptidase
VLPVERAPAPGQIAAPPAGAAPATYTTASATSVPVALEPARPAQARSGWMIQLGAFPKEAEAKDRLREAQSMAGKIVARAEPFTEKVMKGNQELYRARFAGFSQDSAEAACKHFKRNDIVCMVTKN